MIFDIDDNSVITQEGGDIDPYVLEHFGDNPNDPEKKATHCTDKRGIISYEKAKRRFEKYYDTLNTTDSGRMRGKMFDMKYNKKTKKLLYPGLPCSEKYLEANGPAEYDMWGVDAFPEGFQADVNSQDKVISHYYNPKEKYSPDLKYGPEITYTHLLNQYGEEGAQEFLEDNYQNRLFNQYFKTVKPPKWPKRKGKPQKVERPIIEDDDDEQFEEAIQKQRQKRGNKKAYAPMPVLFPKKRPVKQADEHYEPPQFIELPEEVPVPSGLERLNPTDIFQQPEHLVGAPEQSAIDTFEVYDQLDIIYVLDRPALYNGITKYIYEMPLRRDLMEENTDDQNETIFGKYKTALFELLVKPIYALARMTITGIQYYK